MANGKIRMTANEQKLLNAVATSEFHNGCDDPVDNATWTSIVTECLGRSAQGAITSAKKKGWIKSQKGTTGPTGDDPGVIWITRAGMDALVAEQKRATELAALEAMIHTKAPMPSKQERIERGEHVPSAEVGPQPQAEMEAALPTTKLALSNKLEEVSLRYHFSHDAAGAVRERVAIARSAIASLVDVLARIEADSAEQPENWGIAGDAAHVAAGLVELIPEVR